MTLSLVAIMEPHPGVAAYNALGDCDVVAEAGLLAVLWRGGQALASRLGRQFMPRELVRFQQILEALQPLGAVLPAAPGMLLDDAGAARRFLLANAPALREGLERWGLLRQLQIAVSWKADLALKRHFDDPELSEARAVAAAEGMKRAGKALQAGMEAVRARLADGIEARLAAVATERVRLPAGAEDMVLNLAAAVPADRLGELEAAVEAIDATWPEGFKIKLIGPLPAVSFASVVLDHIDGEALLRARRTLGLEPEAAPDAVRDAFRRLVKAAHPDLGGDADAAREIVDARALLARVESAFSKLAEAGCDPQAAPAPLARLRREGDMERAA